MPQLDEYCETLFEKGARAALIVLFRCKPAQIGEGSRYTPSISNAPEKLEPRFAAIFGLQLHNCLHHFVIAVLRIPEINFERRGLKQLSDVRALEKLVDEIVANNPDKVADAKANPKAIGWFVGQVMKASGGKANPQTVNALLKKRLAA